MPDETQPVAPTVPAPEAPVAPVTPTATVAPAAPATPAKNPVEVFKEKYQALVVETGHSINVEPKYIKRDDGSYSTVLETTILPIR